MTTGIPGKNSLRYGLFRTNNTAERPHDSELEEMEYTDDLWSGYEHRLQPIISSIKYTHGEAVPTAPSSQELNYLTYTPWRQGHPCTVASFDPYKCSAPIGVIYWTLAFNRIRIPYGTSEAGTTILYQSPYTPNPERLANVANSYAIAGMLEEGTVATYMDRVYERYFLAKLDGWINEDELENVRDAMGVHCLGPLASSCQSYHRTSGQLRPALYTAKRSFWKGHDEHFLRAEEMRDRISGTPIFQPFGTADGLGYVTLDSPNDGVCGEVYFFDKGSVSVEGAFRGRGLIRVWVSIGGEDPQLWEIDANQGNWVWADGGPVFQLDEAGYYPVCLNFEDGVDIDVLLLKQ